MAMIFLGKSECPLCGQLLVEEDEIIALPAISDTLHSLYRFFDTGFHKVCFDNWDKKLEVQAILEKEHKDFEKSDFYLGMMAKYGKPKSTGILDS